VIESHVRRERTGDEPQVGGRKTKVAGRKGVGGLSTEAGKQEENRKGRRRLKREDVLLDVVERGDKGGSRQCRGGR